MNVNEVVENDLKWVMITSLYKNESWGDRNSTKMKSCMKANVLEIINNKFFICLSLSNPSSDNFFFHFTISYDFSISEQLFCIYLWP